MTPALRNAFRSHLQSPGMTAVALLMLVVGIGTNTAVFSTLHAVLLQQLPFPEPQQLVLGRVTRDGRRGTNVSAHDYLDYREQSGSFSSLAALTSFSFRVTFISGDPPQRFDAARASWNLFSTLGIDPLLGRHFSPEDEAPDAPPVIMVSHSFWQRCLGGDRQVVGRPLVLDGQTCTVAGVLPAGFHFIHAADIWISLRRNGPSAGARRFHNWLVTGRLRPGTTLSQAQAEIDAVSHRLEELYPGSNAGKGMWLDPLHVALTESFEPQILLLMGAVGLVLIIVCANLAGLLLARGVARRRELAVRTALGASRPRLVRDLLAESLVLALAGGFLGVGLALWLQRLLPVVLSLDRLGIERLGGSGAMLLFALAVSLLTAVLFGILPALRSTAGNLSLDLRSGTWRGGSGSGGRTRRTLVMAQVALSLVLLVGSGLLVRSLQQLLRTDLGFDTDNLLTAEVELPPGRYSDEELIPLFSGLLEEVRAFPGVTAAGMISQLPLRDPGNDIYVWRPEEPPADHAAAVTAYTRTILPGYFEALSMPLLAGRSIGTQDRPGATPALVINQRMARDLFGAEDNRPGGGREGAEGAAGPRGGWSGNPVGNRVAVGMGGDEPVLFTVVGVVGDARITNIGIDPPRTMYHSYLQFPRSMMRLALRTSSPSATLTSELRAAVWRRDRDVPVEDLQSMESLIQTSVTARRVTTSLLALFSALALLLAVIGLYSVLTHWVSQRRYELGVRMALGARGADLVRQVAAQGLLVVGIGIAAGLAAAIVVSRLLRQLLYGVEATDPYTYLAVTLLFAAAALLACLIPARRAVRVDPAMVLRAE